MLLVHGMLYPSLVSVRRCVCLSCLSTELCCYLISNVAIEIVVLLLLLLLLSSLSNEILIRMQCTRNARGTPLFEEGHYNRIR